MELEALLHRQSLFSGRQALEGDLKLGITIAGAAVEFEAILHRQSGDAVAANNLAVAKMYSVDLTGAVTTLEGCLQVCTGPLLQGTPTILCLPIEMQL